MYVSCLRATANNSQTSFIYLFFGSAAGEHRRPVPDQGSLRIDHLVGRFLPELYHTCLWAGAGLWPEIDVSHDIEPALPDLPLSVRPALEEVPSLSSQFPHLFGG